MCEECDFKIDWCSYEAAKYACEHWHYSGGLPAGKLIKIGVWEDSKYIGCVLFGRGATCNIGRPYGLDQTGVCELVRVALNRHINPVTMYISIAIKKLRNLCPEMKLIISYADSGQGHEGKIYQAGNWIYQGFFSGECYLNINGKTHHRRSIGAKYGTSSIDKLKSKGINAHSVPAAGKYKYLMPLDKKMRKQVEPLRLPYPRPLSVAVNTTSNQDDDGGSNPTRGLSFANG